MPSTNEHSARITDPDKYTKIRRQNDEFGKGIDVLYGILKNGDTEVQAIHFDKDKFTADEARKWLKDNDYKPIEFVAASEKSNSMKLEYKLFRFNLLSSEEIKANNQNYGMIKGYASTFGNVDRGGDIIEKGAFVKCLDSYRRDGKQIPMCYQHSMMDIIGGFDTTKMVEDEKGLYVEGKINLEVMRGQDAYALAKQGVLSDMSIGYMSEDSAFETNEDGGIIRKLKEVTIWEISMVAIPMNPEARITDVKSKQNIKMNDCADIVKIQEIQHICNKDHLPIKEKKYLLEKLLHSGILSKNASKFIVEKIFEEAQNNKNNSSFNNTEELNKINNEFKSILDICKKDKETTRYNILQKELTALIDIIKKY